MKPARLLGAKRLLLAPNGTAPWHAIGTRAAFRGFEQLMHLPEVVIADEPREFQAAIRTVLLRPPPERPEREAREALRWDQCLQPLPIGVGRIRKRREG